MSETYLVSYISFCLIFTKRHIINYQPFKSNSFSRSSLAYLPGSVHGGSMTNSSSSSLPSITTLNNANVFVKQEPTDADQLLKRQQHHMQQQQQQQQQHNTGKISTRPSTLTSTLWKCYVFTVNQILREITFS